MRKYLLLLLAGTLCLPSTNAAPRSKSKAKAKTSAKPRPVSATRATPLSPAQLKGKVVYVLGREVWALDPQSRRKTLLYKDLFFPSNKDPNKYTDNYGGSLIFDRASIAWSPDLTRIAFTHYDPRFQGSELFVMRWDGKEKRQLSKGKYASVISSPRWSPNGQTIMCMQSSPYRMGGPGYGSRGVFLVGVDGETKSFNTRDDKGEFMGGTFSDPYWSRDGQRILLSYSTESADYVDGTNTSLKVASLDNTPVVDFKGNWSDFLVDNQSRNGVWLLKHDVRENYSTWELTRSGTTASQGVIWSDTEGFKATRFVPNDNGRQFVFAGNFVKWTIDAQGMTKPDYLFGIWFLEPNIERGTFARLLIKDGRLVDWF